MSYNTKIQIKQDLKIYRQFWNGKEIGVNYIHITRFNI